MMFHILRGATHQVAGDATVENGDTMGRKKCAELNENLILTVLAEKLETPHAIGYIYLELRSGSPSLERVKFNFM